MPEGTSCNPSLLDIAYAVDISMKHETEKPHEIEKGDGARVQFRRWARRHGGNLADDDADALSARLVNRSPSQRCCADRIGYASGDRPS